MQAARPRVHRVARSPLVQHLFTPTRTTHTNLSSILHQLVKKLRVSSHTIFSRRVTPLCLSPLAGFHPCTGRLAESRIVILPTTTTTHTHSPCRQLTARPRLVEGGLTHAELKAHRACGGRWRGWWHQCSRHDGRENMWWGATKRKSRGVIIQGGSHSSSRRNS